ncbi:hypothetical protein BCR42DRAFT_410549 [Absidia repens]|uniref:Uncharacterized protein n=1 Tax=Absidia repens TaxID=90262 RepID=A0A1X2IP43_9FUNG|nr:hypothetical protein BCR42DRAFT_410549 [Absidia repens]
MRIKISASTDSSPSYDFWYAIDDKTSQKGTILDLKKNLNKVAPMAKKSKHLTLSLDGFLLLPTSPINDLIRDGDTIRVQHGLNNSSTPKTKDTKRKEKDDTMTKPKKRKRQDTDTDQQQKQQLIVDTKTKRQKKKKTKQLDNNNATTSLSTTEAPQLSPSKKRNLRRARSRIARRENQIKQQSTVKEHVATSSANKHSTQEADVDDDNAPIEISSKDNVEPSRQLLKKNKNKKKNFLKQMDKTAQSQHIVFDGTTTTTTTLGGDDDNDDTTAFGADKQDNEGGMTEEQEYHYGSYYYVDEDTTPTTTTANDPYMDETMNPYGGAFITESESQQVRNNNRKQRNYGNRNYPVDALDSVFFATDEQEEQEKIVDKDGSSSSSSDSDSDSDSSDSDSSDSDSSDEDEDDGDDVAKVVESEETDEIEQQAEKVDYETYPALTFQGPQVPAVGDHLAIKTLHLSETYTPEISDWKEIKVVELTGQEMVVERVSRTSPSQLKVKKSRLRKFDLPPEHEQQQEDDDDNLTESFNYNDVFEIRRLPK